MRLARADSTCDVVAEEEFVLLEELKSALAAKKATSK